MSRITKHQLILSSLLWLILWYTPSCTSSKKTTGVWINEEIKSHQPFNKVLVIAMSGYPSARKQVENDLQAAATRRQISSVKSVDIWALPLTQTRPPSKDSIVSAMKAHGCDAVLISAILKKEEAIRYEPGKTAYSARPYYSMMGNYYGYYSQWYPVVSKEGYYDLSKNYFIQTNLYDGNTEELVWSVQSTVFNPGSIEKFSREYTKTLMDQLTDAKLIKKQP